MTGSPGDIRPFTVTHRTVLSISVPMMLAYLSTPLVGIINTGVVGQLGSAALIGGVAVASVIFEIVLSSFNFLRAGTTGLTAQAVGAGDALEELAVLARACVVALILGVLVVLLQYPIGQLGYAVFGVTGEVATAAADYFDVRVWSAPVLLFNYAILGWMLGRGDAVASMLLQTLLNGINAGLAIWFVLGLDWGVAGAAWAALIAETVTLLAGLAFVARRLKPRQRPDRAQIFDMAQFRRAMSMNVDMLARSLALLIGISFFTHQSAALGTDMLAANTILLRIYMFTTAWLDGIATAAEQLAGRATGARFRPAFDRTVTLTTKWGLGTAVCLAAFLYLAGPALIGAMTTVEEVRTLANTYLVWAAVLPLAGVIAFQMDGIFIGATWSRDMRNMMVLSLVVYVVAWALLMPRFGNHGLWAAFLIFHGARSIVFSYRLKGLARSTFPPLS